MLTRSELILQEVGIHPIVPAQTLQSTPLDNAVALLPLSEVAAANGAGVELPSCSTRMAITVDGTEPEEQIAALKVLTLLRETIRCRLFTGHVVASRVMRPWAKVMAKQ